MIPVSPGYGYRSVKQTEAGWQAGLDQHDFMVT